MKDRRPRKLKKVLKARYSLLLAMRVASLATISAITSKYVVRMSSIVFPDDESKSSAISELLENHNHEVNEIFKEGHKTGGKHNKGIAWSDVNVELN